jgi:hypothetical protein
MSFALKHNNTQVPITAIVPNQASLTARTASQRIARTTDTAMANGFFAENLFGVVVDILKLPR